MRFTVEKNDFLKALSHGQSIVEKRTTIPILSNVLLEVNGQSLSLTATDTEMTVVEVIPAVVFQEGAITVSAHMLFDIVRKLPDNCPITIALDANSSQISLSSSRSKFHLSVLPAEDFPKLTQDDLPCVFSMPAAQLKHLLDDTRFAMSTEETRYYLNGVHFHVYQGEQETLYLRAVATDAHRLACLDVPLPSGAESLPPIILGRKAVMEIRKLVDDCGETITIRLSPTRIEFSFDNLLVCSRLIDGTFPTYQEVIPYQNQKNLVINTKEFSQAVDRVSTIADDKFRAIKMTLEKDHMTLTSMNQNIGSAREELSVKFPYPEKIEIGFNATYLTEILKHTNGGNVVFKLEDAGKPALIMGEEEQKGLYVLMPIRA